MVDVTACLLSFCLFRTILAEWPFRNTSLSYEERVRDLVNRLDAVELVLQMSKGGGGKHGGPAPPIPRLGISPFQWDSECLRGDVGAGNATSFPQSIGLAATFKYVNQSCLLSYRLSLSRDRGFLEILLYEYWYSLSLICAYSVNQ